MDTWFLVQQANGQWAKIKSFLSGGVHTPYTTGATANSFIIINDAAGNLVRIATVLTGDIHTIAVVAQ